MKEIQRQGHIKTNKEVQRQRQRNTETKKYKDRYKTILKPPSQSDPGAFWPLRHLIKMTKRVFNKEWQWKKHFHLNCDAWQIQTPKRFNLARQLKTTLNETEQYSKDEKNKNWSI